MALLALDQASIITGYAIFENQKLISNGKFELNDTDFGKRLFNFRKQISDLITNYKINEVAFEDIYADKEKVNNIQTFKKLAEVYGVLEELLTELNISHSSYLAAEWKPTVGIKGGKRPEQKKLAQKYILDNYDKKVTQDEADAICIGIHHLKNKEKVNFDWS